MVGNKIIDDINRQLEYAGGKYSDRFDDIYQALGVIRCEYRELEDEIYKHGTPQRIRDEAIQVAAMAIKLVGFLDHD